MIRSLLVTAGVLASLPAHAHFGLILPPSGMVDTREVPVTIAFLHPWEQAGMVMERPEQVSLTVDGETQDLTDTLTPSASFGSDAWQMSVPLSRPGVHVLSLTPTPYWEPDEDVFIRHYTKTYISAFGSDEGWDAELGLPTEIVPLTRPFGLWAGNLFQGIVKRDGEPVPFAEVEVEHFNETGATVPGEIMITQTVKADGNGVFSYAAPNAGWWGFAALSTADETMSLDGVDKEVELGAVIWVEFKAWSE